MDSVFIVSLRGPYYLYRMNRMIVWLRRVFSFEIRWMNHLMFWLFIILFFTTFPSFYYDQPFYRILAYNLLYIPFDILAVYITLYFLVPRYLIKGKPWWFFLGISLLAAFNFFILIRMFIQPVLEPFLGWKMEYGHWLKEFIDSFVMMMFIIGLATVLKFIRYYYNLRLEKSELEKTNLQSELKVLRSQITPHFLFNVLNNIDELIYEDRDRASRAIFRFSGLLRKLFKEMGTDWIPLKEELDHVADFVELMRLGFRSPGFLRFEVNGDPGVYMIPPMILMPIVENTFKHAERKTTDPGIQIRIRIDEGILQLTTRNHIRHRHNPEKSSGTGMKNLTRRLNYLYPEKYRLKLDRENDEFVVKLTMQL